MGEKERLEGELMKTKKDNLDMKQKIDDLEDKVDQCPCQASQTSIENDPPPSPPSKKYLQETKHEIFPTKPVKPNNPVKPDNPAKHVINIKRMKPNKRV